MSAEVRPTAPITGTNRRFSQETPAQMQHRLPSALTLNHCFASLSTSLTSMKHVTIQEGGDYTVSEENIYPSERADIMFYISRVVSYLACITIQDLY